MPAFVFVYLSVSGTVHKLLEISMKLGESVKHKLERKPVNFQAHQNYMPDLGKPSFFFEAAQKSEAFSDTSVLLHKHSELSSCFYLTVGSTV